MHMGADFRAEDKLGNEWDTCTEQSLNLYIAPIASGKLEIYKILDQGVNGQ
jgi:hypothetical protein